MSCTRRPLAVATKSSAMALAGPPPSARLAAAAAASPSACRRPGWLGCCAPSCAAGCAPREALQATRRRWQGRLLVGAATLQRDATCIVEGCTTPQNRNLVGRLLMSALCRPAAAWRRPPAASLPCRADALPLTEETVMLQDVQRAHGFHSMRRSEGMRDVGCGTLN